jgi:hypothetical protein
VPWAAISEALPVIANRFQNVVPVQEFSAKLTDAARISADDCSDGTPPAESAKRSTFPFEHPRASKPV